MKTKKIIFSLSICTILGISTNSIATENVLVKKADGTFISVENNARSLPVDGGSGGGGAGAGGGGGAGAGGGGGGGHHGAEPDQDNEDEPGEGDGPPTVE